MNFGWLNNHSNNTQRCIFFDERRCIVFLLSIPYPSFSHLLFALCVPLIFLLRTPCFVIVSTPEKKSIDFAEQKGCY